MPKTSRPIERDQREYDTTQLKLGGHGRTLHRDYSSHFFRWSFAGRFITAKDSVLEIGCGEERPLSKILTGGAAAHVDQYVGVDLNKLKESNSQRLHFYGEFNFNQRYKELIKTHGTFDIVVHLEVIEHMKVMHGRKLLRAAFECLKPGGVMLMSTPAYDGKRHAANHIHEYTIPELQKEVEKAGFVVNRRFGTFMDIKHIKKVKSFELLPEDTPWNDDEIHGAIKIVSSLLGEYYDNDAISNIFGPLFPNHARNNLWVCQKPDQPQKKVTRRHK